MHARTRLRMAVHAAETEQCSRAHTVTHIVQASGASKHETVRTATQALAQSLHAHSDLGSCL
eukprot:6211498-Pleurochrysis_carterae.AAC.1